MSESIYHGEVLFKRALLWKTAFFMFFAGLMALSLKHDKCTVFLKRQDGGNGFFRKSEPGTWDGSDSA